ncbi:MAG: hypothetical protein ACK5X3_02040 [Pseudomonadota bacterium]
MKRTLTMAIAALAGACAPAIAAPMYRIGGGQPQAIPINGVITVPGTISNPTTIHIFDESTAGEFGVPESNVGTLTVRGTLGQGGSLLISVTDADEPATLPAPETTRYNRGLISLGGLRLESPLNPGVEDPALRDATTLIAWIGNPSAADPGSITGTISVGRVYALDVPGDLSGIVTATANDPNLDQGQMAIQRVRVGGNLSGTVQATGGTPPLDASNQVQLLTQIASINTLIVGPGGTSLLASVPAPAGRRDGATR